MNRIKELDGIRGIAIFLVLVWHYIACQVNSKIVNTSVGILFNSLTLTWSGVDLFFVLSGFLIVGILLDTKDSKHYFQTFYMRRILRILPLYILMLVLFILLGKNISNDWLFKQSLPLWSYFTFTQNFFMANTGFGPNWLGITWSLAIEEQFYLVLPFLVWKMPRRRLAFLFLCLICLAPIFRLIFNNLGAYVFPFARADSILMGGLLSIIYRVPNLKQTLVDYYGYLVGLFLVFLFGAGVFTLNLHDIGDVFTHFWLALLYTLFLLVCTLKTGKIVDFFVSNRLFIWLGLRSYGIYLLHQPVSGLMHQYFNDRLAPGFSNLYEFYITLFSFLITFILAEVSFRFFESFFLAYGKKFSYEIQQPLGVGKA